VRPSANVAGSDRQDAKSSIFISPCTADDVNTQTTRSPVRQAAERRQHCDVRALIVVIVLGCATGVNNW